MSEGIEQEDQPRHRIQRYKSEEVMLQECEAYVMAGKRLPKLHSRWLLNRYINAGHSLHGLEVAHKYTLHQLEEANKRLRQIDIPQPAN